MNSTLGDELLGNDAALYAAGIGLLGIASLIALGFWLTLRTRTPFPGVSPWRIRGIDFATFILALLCCVIVAGLLMQLLMGPDAEDTGEPGMGLTLLTGFLMQAGFLAVFLLFRGFLRSHDEQSLSLAPKPIGYTALLGLFSLLATWPLVILGSAAWHLFLTYLKNLGVDLDLTPQDPVEMFFEADHVGQVIALSLLAIVIAPLAEEFVFRAGIFRYLRGHLPLATAAALNGLIFGVIHANLQSFLPLAILGVLLCLAYEWTGDIKVPIFFHAAFNLNTIIIIYLQQ